MRKELLLDPREKGNTIKATESGRKAFIFHLYTRTLQEESVMNHTKVVGIQA